MKMDNNYYNSQKLCNYNAFFNMVLGARSIGKTHHFKYKGLKNFIKNKEQFIYLRRTQTELDELDKEKFFTTTVLEQCYPNYSEIEKNVGSKGTKIIFTTSLDNKKHEMTITTRKIMIDGYVVCYLKALSTWLKLKGSEYDEVTMMMFDEVLIETTSGKNYLSNEVEKLFNLILSIVRDRTNFKCYLLSNATNTNNPYFNYFSFTKKGNKEFYYLKEFDTLLQFPKQTPLSVSKNGETPYFKLIKKSSIYESIVNNEFQEDNNENIGKMKGNKIPLYSITCDKNKIVTLYSCNDCIYVAKTKDKNLSSYTFSLDWISDNCYYLDRGNSISKHIRKNFYINNIFYENQNVKFMFTNAIQKII